MNRFKEVKFHIQGVTLKQLAANKLGKLMMKQERNLELIEDIYRTNLSQSGKEQSKTDLLIENDKISDSVGYLESMKQYLQDGETYNVDIDDLNFLNNDFIVHYQE